MQLKHLTVLFYLLRCFNNCQCALLYNNFNKTKILDSVFYNILKENNCVEIALNWEFERKISQVLTELIETSIPIVMKNTSHQDQCTNHLLFVSNLSDFVDCDFKNRGFGKRNETLILILNQNQMLLDKNYKDDFGYSSVVVVLEDEDEIYVLDPPTLLRRYFHQVSAEHVRTNIPRGDMESKSFVGGGVVRVATFNCPLFSMADNKTGKNIVYAVLI